MPSLTSAFQLERISRSFYPWGASIEVWFSGDPGAFKIDLMGANDDSPEAVLAASLGSSHDRNRKHCRLVSTSPASTCQVLTGRSSSQLM